MLKNKVFRATKCFRGATKSKIKFLGATKCSKTKFFQDSKELKGHNVPGEVVHTEHSVH